MLLAAVLAWPWDVSFGQEDVAAEAERPAAVAGPGRIVSPRRAHGHDASKNASPQLSVTDDEDEDGDRPGRLPASFFEADACRQAAPLIVSDPAGGTAQAPAILRLLRAERMRC
jgi:hypothetical protein